MYGQFFMLFGLILVGYYCNKKGYLTSQTNKNMGSMVMHVTIPAMLVTTISGIEITDQILKGFFLSAAGQAAMMIVFGFLMRFYGRGRKMDSRLLPMLDLTTGSLNTGFIGLPVTMIFFGEAGIVYMSAGVLALNLYLWSYGVYIISGKKETNPAVMGKTFLKGAINPNCMGILLGLALTMTRAIEYVPEMVVGFLTKVGELSTPLSLIYIGALAGSSGIGQLFQEKLALEISLVKMILMPALAILIMYFVPAGSLAKSVFLLSMCMPSAVVVPMMVGQYGYGEKLSSNIVLWTTFISMLTIPLSVWLANLLY
ncbi:AEC family transporter [Anaerotignum sp.]